MHHKLHCFSHVSWTGWTLHHVHGAMAGVSCSSARELAHTRQQRTSCAHITRSRSALVLRHVKHEPC